MQLSLLIGRIAGGPVYPISELVTLIAVIALPDTVAIATAPEPPPPIIFICVYDAM